jgi:hypothetical protein
MSQPMIDVAVEDERLTPQLTRTSSFRGRECEMSLSVFSKEVEPGVPVESYSHNDRFLEVIGAFEISHFAYDRVSDDAMAELTEALGHALNQDPIAQDASWVFVFCSGADCTDGKFSTANTHAVSIFIADPEGMRHRYFERSERGLREVKSLDVTIRSMLDMDDIRILHFAASEMHDLPNVSAIYEFKSDRPAVDEALNLNVFELRRTVLVDARKLAGAPAIGLLGTRPAQPCLGWHREVPTRTAATAHHAVRDPVPARKALLPVTTASQTRKLARGSACIQKPYESDSYPPSRWTSSPPGSSSRNTCRSFR